MYFSLSIRQRTNLLAASFGAASLVVQTEFLRGVMEAAAGGTLAVGSGLGAWLFWIALGAFAGGRLTPFVCNTGKALFFISALALPSAVFPVFFLSSLRQFLGLPAGELIPFTTIFLWSAVACSPSALLVGISFPFLSKLAARDHIAHHSGAAFFIGGVWASEAAGSFAAGVIFTFLLAGRTNPLFNTAVFGSLPLLLYAVSGFFPGKAGKLLSISSVLGCLVLFTFIPHLERAISSRYWQGLGSPGELISQRWSRYRNLVVARLGSQTTFFDNSQPVLSFPDPFRVSSQVSLLLSQHPALSRILVVGPCSGGLAQALLSTGVEKLSAVFPDAVTENEILANLPDSMRALLEVPSYNHIADDARTFLRSSRAEARDTAAWDMVLINLDGPAHMNSSRYYTPGFFTLARRAFSPAGGVLALRLPIGANVMLPAQLDQVASVWSSLRNVFSHLALGIGTTHCYIFASDTDSIVSEDISVLSERVAPFEGRVPLLTRYTIPMFFDPARVAPMREKIRRRSYALGSHTDSTPVAWLHSLRLWARLARQSHHQTSGPGLIEDALDFLSKRKFRGLAFWPAVLLSLIFLSIWLVFFNRGKTARALRWAAFISTLAAGFSAMGATVTLIYLCQLVFGALFYQVAMITAIFMLSMALGSNWASKRALPSASCLSTVAILSFLLSVAVTLPSGGTAALEAILDIPGVWGTVLSMALFYLMVAAVGLSCGALFPWFAALYDWEKIPDRTGRTAAAIDCADHLGAMAGAFTVGVFAVPALGITQVSLSLALSLVCVALFWYALSSR